MNEVGAKQMRWWICVLVWVIHATIVAAQTPGASPAPVIAGPDIARYLDVLGADSMRGPTPSRELDRVARYLAGEFRALGAARGLPSDNDTAWMYPYQLPGQVKVDYTTAGLQFVCVPFSGSTPVVRENGNDPFMGYFHEREMLTFAAGARFLSSIMPAPMTGFESRYKSMILMAGPQTVASVTAAADPMRIALYVPPAGTDSATKHAILQALVAHSAGVVVLSLADSARFAEQIHMGAAHPAAFADAYMPQSERRSWIAEVRGETIRATLALNGVDLTAVQTSRTPVVQRLPFLLVTLQRELPEERLTAGVTAPNVVATVPGNDGTLGKQWVVVAASIDQLGTDNMPNTLGVAGLLVLARAFAAPDARPRRPIVFVATSRSSAAFAGSRSFLVSAGQANAMLAVTLDLGTYPSRDSLAIDGMGDLTFKPSTSPTIALVLHPELGMTLVDTGSVLVRGSQANVFASHWIPTIGIRGAGRPAPPAAIAQSRVRLLSAAFYVIQALANAGEWPEWSMAAKKVMTTQSPP